MKRLAHYGTVLLFSLFLLVPTTQVQGQPQMPGPTIEDCGTIEYSSEVERTTVPIVDCENPFSAAENPSFSPQLIINDELVVNDSIVKQYGEEFRNLPLEISHTSNASNTEMKLRIFLKRMKDTKKDF